MHFCYSEDILRDYPELATGALYATGINADASVDAQIAHFAAIAEGRLANGAESELPEIQAWRRAFSKMGLKPTQYRSASESLLRRFRKEKSLPRIHPLIDLSNAVSLAFAIPVAVFDVSKIADYLEVRHAGGDEKYLAFSGETESPERGEVIFADNAGCAHARRWVNRQSALSAVREETASVLIVVEAMHDSGLADIQDLVATLADEIEKAWPVSLKTAVLDRPSQRFEFQP